MSRKRPLESDSNEFAQPVKRARNYTDEDAKLARLYEQLSDESRDVQVDGAISLVEYYQAHASPDSVLVRLLRGICSSRKAARLGFFTALVEVLRVSPEKDLQILCEKIRKNTEPVTAASKSERRDYKLGRLTAYTAILHAGLLFDETSSAESASQVLQESLALAKKNPQLVEQCGHFWVDYIQQAAARGRTAAVETLLNEVHEAGRSLTPEGVAVWLKASSLSPNASFPRSVWLDSDPLGGESSDEVTKLSRALGSSNAEMSGNGHDATHVVTSGMARRSPHFVWTILIEALIMRAKRRQKKQKKRAGDAPAGQVFGLQWNSLVDEPYFRDSASPETKSIGFQICGIAVSMVPDTFFRATLGSRLLNCLANQLGSEDRLLHQRATEFMKNIKTRASSKDHTSALSNFVQALEGAISTDIKASTANLKKVQPTLMDAIESASLPALASLLGHYQSSIVAAAAHREAKPEQLAERMSLIADQIVSVFEAGTKQHDFKIQSSALSLLFDHACTTTQNRAAYSAEQSRLYHQVFRARMWTCVRILLMSARSDSGRSAAWVEVVSEATKAASNHAMQIDEQQTKEVEFFPALRDAPHSIFAMIRRAVEDVSDTVPMVRSQHQPQEISQSSHDKPLMEGCLTLLTVLLLQTYCGDEDAMNMLEDLQKAYREGKNTASLDGPAFDAAEAAILFLLSKEETVYRIAAEHAYSAFAGSVTRAAQNLLSVLGKAETLAGQQELFDPEAEDEWHSDQSSPDLDSDDEVDSDVEVVSINGENADEGEVSSSGDDSASEDDSEKEDTVTGSDEETEESVEDEEANAEDEALNASLGRILGTAALANGISKKNDTGEDPNSNSDSDSDMTDSAMEAMGVDDKLTDIFRQRGQASGKTKSSSKDDQKKAQKDAKQNMVQFKSRVLGLLSIFVDVRFASVECLHIILPLCKLVGSTRDAQLSRKASELLERYIKLSRKKQNGLPTSASQSMLEGRLSEVHNEAIAWKSHAHMAACSRASLFIARILVEKTKSSEKGDVPDMVKILKARYDETREAKVERKSDIPEVFGENFRTWLGSMGLT